MKVAFLFPGQGSQQIGMARGFYDALPEARALFEEADALLGFSLSRLCFEGPEEALGETENTQPALFVAGMAAHAALRQVGIAPSMAAGHSLGEYTALAAAGAIAFLEGVRIVRLRGEIMAAISRQSPGGMAAVLGLPAEAVEEICRNAAAGEVLEVANYNAPQQAVVSGTAAAVERATELARERGAWKALPLKVSAPFHSRLMSGAAEQMSAALREVEIRPPQIPVVANVTAGFVSTPDEIRAALVRQLAGAVRWTESVRRLADAGATHCVEAGPGKVLCGLAARIDRSLTCFPAESPERVAAAREALRTP
jgi:[acyl-carrier-protein] S-malonyltransferase